MSKHRNWTVRGFDTATYTQSTSVQLSDVGTATTLSVPSERKAVEMLLVHDTLKTMSPVTMTDTTSEPLIGYYVRVDIPVNAYSQLRASVKKLLPRYNNGQKNPVFMVLVVSVLMLLKIQLLRKIQTVSTV